MGNSPGMRMAGNFRFTCGGRSINFGASIFIYCSHFKNDLKLKPKVQLKLKPKVQLKLKPKVQLKLKPKVQLKLKPKVQLSHLVLQSCAEHRLTASTPETTESCLTESKCNALLHFLELC